VNLPFPPLLVITDRQQALRPLEEVAAACFAAGCRWLSLREKDLGSTDRLTLLRHLISLGEKSHAIVTVHGDLDAAERSGAAGVHLPGGTSPVQARRRLGSTALIGVSAHSAEEIAQAGAEGADYVTLSPIFVSASKPGYGPALGLEALRRASPLPVLALGGIDQSNAARCAAAGAAGVAVMGSLMSARDPAAVMAALLKSLRAGLARGGAGTP
jgi:thiamine-phosphate pyrophosphorylase